MCRAAAPPEGDRGRHPVAGSGRGAVAQPARLPCCSASARSADRHARAATCRPSPRRCRWAIPANCCASAPTCAWPSVAWPLRPHAWAWPPRTCSRGCRCPASSGFLGGDASGLVNGNNKAWSLTPSLSWAAFDFGTVRARLRASKAEAEGVAAQYEQAVLLALEDTENALTRYSKQQARLAIVVEHTGRTACRITGTDPLSRRLGRLPDPAGCAAHAVGGR